MTHGKHKLSVFTSAMVFALGAAASMDAFAKDESSSLEASIEAQADTPSVIILSETLGDAGYEMLLGNPDRISGSALSTQVDAAFAYANIDTIGNPAKTFDQIDSALAQGIPVILESAYWDVDGLHAFVSAYDASINLQKLENVALELSLDKTGQVIATDTTPTNVALMAGVPYEETGEAAAEARLERQTRDPIHWLAPFASEAYLTFPSDWIQHGLIPMYLIKNRDRFKMWRGTTIMGVKLCAIGIRGTNNISDWITNGQSQFLSSAMPYGGYSGDARIGYGWRERMNNIIFEIDEVLDQENCDDIYVTGHSLGGATTAAVAFALDHGGGKDINAAIAFNPARVGNLAFRSEINSLIWQVELYCRHWDPVWDVPIGLRHFGNGQDGCTYWGNAVTYINLAANHNMDLWL